MHNLLNKIHNKIHALSNSTIDHIVLGAALVILLAVLIAVLYSLRARSNYSTHWKALQKKLSDKSSWSEAVTEADKMLDLVLKKRHFKGKTMGERLVSAQHELSANDMVWYSHKLSNKVLNEGLEVSKAQVKKALLGFWRALKDLGAFGKAESSSKAEENEQH
ncbi:MAG: hypothetical protein ACREF7_01925 [Candidatus Saccharimonadales bacterium]